jgi:hypothetical protein
MFGHGCCAEETVVQKGYDEAVEAVGEGEEMQEVGC